MAESFGERTRAAATWSISGDVAERAVRLAFGIALARLLSPRDFGVLAMVTILTDFVISIADLGLRDALVQKRELSEAQRSTVFWVTAGGGVVLTAAVMLCAPWIARFYAVPELTHLAIIVSVVCLLSALGTVPRALVTRRLDFRTVATLQCATAIAAGTAAVILAWRGAGVVSLVADLLITTGLETLLFFVACGWRPRLEVRRTVLVDLFGFGCYRVFTRTLGYSALHVDELLVGKFLGSDALGIYGRAYNLARFPVLYVSRAIVRVMFPSLARLQDDPPRLRDVYLRATGAVALVTVPLCMGLFATAEPFVVGLLGPQWRETAPLLRIFCVASLVQSITTLAGTLYLSQGRADLQFRLTALQRVSSIAAVVIGLRWGIYGVATAFALATVLNGLSTLYFAGRLVHLRMATVFARARPVLLASMAMTMVIAALDASLGAQMHPLAQLSLEVGTGVLVYWLALHVFRVRAYTDVVGWLVR